MRAFGVVVSGLAALALLFVVLGDSISAQGAKDEKKTEEKKTEKKTEKKVRLADPSEVNRAKKKIGKIKEYKSDEPAEITVTLVDMTKLQEYNTWDSNQKKDIRGTTDKKGRIEKFQKYEAAKGAEYDKIYAGDEIQVPVNEHVRVRTAFVPKKYDKNDKEVKLTGTQISALKPPLPGYTNSAANLKIGQIVELYLKPHPPAPRTPQTPVTKKAPIGADPKDTGLPVANKTEVYMIQVLHEPQ
jgi:hypothetical protein